MSDSVTIVEETNLPPPDAMIRCKDGDLIAVMFYYAAADQCLDYIAGEHGFEFQAIGMERDLGPDDPLVSRYEDGDGDVVRDWKPTPQDGWQFAIKFDSDDGPIAGFIRALSAPEPPRQPLPNVDEGK